MSWPDDKQPRYIVDTHPTVRVLDRAYNHAIVEEWWRMQTRRNALDQADSVAAALNRADEATDVAA